MAATGMKWASWLLRALVLLMIVQSVVGVTWGSFTRAECMQFHKRKWYSRLFDIQGDWNTACRNTPATVNGQFFSSPTNCVNKGVGGEWGEFWVDDATCNDQSSLVGVTWGSFTRAECVRFGKRKWYSRLFDIQGDWNTACRNTPATVNGQHFDRPDNCVNKGVGGEWGEFYVDDATCNDQSSLVGVTWGSFTRAECVRFGKRKWYSRLFDIQGDWNTACRNTPATVNGQPFDRPDNCVNKGVGGEWGEFYVDDDTCNFEIQLLT